MFLGNVLTQVWDAHFDVLKKRGRLALDRFLERVREILHRGLRRFYRLVLFVRHGSKLLNTWGDQRASEE